MAHVLLRVIRTPLFTQGACGVCAGAVIAQHYDHDLRTIIGRCCKTELISAEIFLLAVGLAHPPLRGKNDPTDDRTHGDARTDGGGE